MCVVVDANQASLVLNPSPDPAYAPVMNNIRTKLRLVVGGRLADELMRIGQVRGILVALQRTGRLYVANAEKVDADTTTLEVDPNLQSDDPHVLALVRVSGARTVVTEDQALIRDLHNRKLVPSPRVSIYKGIDRRPNPRTLKHSKGCPGWKATE